MAIPSAPDDIPITHHKDELRFEAQVQGQLAICEYELQGDRMVFTHTYVPPELRGRGVAHKLVSAALDHAREQKRHVVPLCSYVAAFIKRHPDYQSLVAAV